MGDKYFIWSNEHRAWWKPGRMGYTPFLDDAGVYSQLEALAICRSALGGWRASEPMPELPVKEADLKMIFGAVIGLVR